MDDSGIAQGIGPWVYLRDKLIYCIKNVYLFYTEQPKFRKVWCNLCCVILETVLRFLDYF